MLKEIIIIACIIAIVIGGNVFTQMYTKRSVELMNTEIDKLSDELVIDGVSQQVMQENYNKIMQVWEERFKILAYYIEHDELEKVKTELVVLGANMEVGDYEKGLEELEKCKFILEHIEQKEECSLMNVF